MTHILASCHKKSEKTRLKALATILQISESEIHFSQLPHATRGCLVRTLQLKSSRRTQKLAMTCIHRFCLDNDESKRDFANLGLLDYIAQTLQDCPETNSDLKYVAIGVAHSISTCNDTHSKFVEANLLPTLADAARYSYGNINMQRTIIHTLVRLVSSFETSDAVDALSELAERRIIPVLASCFHRDDTELISWSVFLLHEFVAQNVRMQEVLRIRGFYASLNSFLQQSQSVMPRVILRILKSLSTRAPDFFDNLRSSRLIPTIVGYINSNDDETQYWSLLTLHAICEHSDFHSDVIKARAIENLSILCKKKSTPDHLLVFAADIFALFYSVPSNGAAMAKHDVLDVILLLCKSLDDKIQYSGAALLLNVVTLNINLAKAAVDRGAIELFNNMITPHKNINCVIISSKGLISICAYDAKVRFRIMAHVIRPLLVQLGESVATCVRALYPCLNRTRLFDSSPVPVGHESELEGSPQTSPVHGMDHGSHGRSSSQGPGISPKKVSRSQERLELNESCQRVSSILMALSIFIRPDLLDHGLPEGEPNLGDFCKDVLQETASSLLDLLVLPLVDEDEVESKVSVSENGQVVVSAVDGSNSDTSAPMRRAGVSNRDSSKDVVQSKKLVASEALNTIQALMQYPEILEYLTGERMSSLLLSLLQSNHFGLGIKIMRTLYACLENGMEKSEILDLNYGFISLLQFATLEASPVVWFLFSLIAQRLCIFELPIKGRDRQDAFMTPLVLYSPHSRIVYNDQWTFESVRMDFPVTQGGKFMYEFELMSDGVMQIGWATEQCTFNGELGKGVGDDFYSYAYDGYRIKKWHGDQVTFNEYGITWTEGSIVTTTIDLVKCEIAFYLDGEELGVAFTEIDPSLNWYPAVSLTSKQGGRFLFGGALDRLKYPVGDAFSIASLYEANSTHIIREVSGQTFSPMTEPEKSDNDDSWLDPAHLPAFTPNEQVPSPTLTETETIVPDVGISFYFEVAIGQLNEMPMIGMLVRCNSIIMVCMDTSSGTLLWIKVNARYDDISVFPLNPTEPSLLKQVIHDTTASIQNGSIDPSIIYHESIDILHVSQEISFGLGDVIGCGLASDQTSVFFTLNGNRMGPPVSCFGVTQCTPFLSQVSRYSLNVGQEPFITFVGHRANLSILGWET